MRALLFLILAFLSHAQAWSHDPNLVSYQVYAEHGRWLLRIDLASSSLTFLPNSLATDSEDFNDAFAGYLRDHVEFILDGDQRVELGDGGIKSGTHATEAIFLLNHFDAHWMTLDAHLTGFSANDQQRHLLRIISESGTSKAFLDASTDFAAHFERVRIGVGAE